MTIYLDSDYCCHLEDGDDRQAIETDAFDGMGSVFIECYRLIPEGESWVNPDGVAIHGFALFPAIHSSRFELAQKQYEEDEVNHLEELGALIDEIYNEDMEVIG